MRNRVARLDHGKSAKTGEPHEGSRYIPQVPAMEYIRTAIPEAFPMSLKSLHHRLFCPSGQFVVLCGIMILCRTPFRPGKVLRGCIINSIATQVAGTAVVGEAFDVAVDIRKWVTDFGKWLARSPDCGKRHQFGFLFCVRGYARVARY